MSYRKDHQSTINETNYTQHIGNYIQHDGVDFSSVSTEKLEKLWLDTVEKGMHGLCFSMYEDGQKPGDIISEEQVNRRIQIINGTLNGFALSLVLKGMNIFQELHIKMDSKL